MISKIISNKKITTTTNDKNVKFSENKSTFILDNKSQKLVLKIKTDCESLSCIEKCDYVAEVENDAFYIELKGTDVKKAYTQIISTLKIFIERHKQFNKRAVIVHTRSPQIDSTIQRYKKLMSDKKIQVITGKRLVIYEI